MTIWLAGGTYRRGAATQAILLVASLLFLLLPTSYARAQCNGGSDFIASCGYSNSTQLLPVMPWTCGDMEGVIARRDFVYRESDRAYQALGKML